MKYLEAVYHVRLIDLWCTLCAGKYRLYGNGMVYVTF